MDKYTGKKLDGRYEIRELIGVGGMANVYHCYDTIDAREVAIKILKDEFLDNEDFIRRFKNESKAIAVLNHPNIVRVYDVSFGDMIQYIVMEYIDGITLKEYIDMQKVLDWKETIHLTTQILKALQHAHENGIVHRDIKLGNVLLSSDGHVVLSDFGISRLFSERLRSDVKAANTIVSDTATATRLVMGTQGYMAPEVARGEGATPAADSYSLGVMFVYLLTGIWYEPGSKVFKLLETLEYRWIDVLPRLLAENPAERPTDLSELAETLQSAPVAEPETAKEPEAPPRRKSRVHLALAGAAVLVVAVAGYFAFSRRPASSAADDVTSSPISASSASDDFDAAFSPRGIYEEPRQ